MSNPLRPARLPLPDHTASVPSVDPLELAAELADGRELVLLDVRRPDERAFCRLPDNAFIPVDTLPYRLGELSSESEIVVYCHHGNRSAWATLLLSINGFQKVRNLTGGTEAWSLEVDPTVPRY